MSNYQSQIDRFTTLCATKAHNWQSINPEYASRMHLQNRFKTGLDIANYTAKIMREDMARYDADPAQYTQSLGCWHGFTAQQMMMAIKRHQKTTKGAYVYLSGWMVAALRSEFGPLPDQSMHEKTAVPKLIEEIYTFLKQADARELDHLYKALDRAQSSGQDTTQIQSQIDNFETHIVPIIADIDAGFGNEEATYLLAKQMIEAGACAIQIENQVSDAKQCGHQAGKVTVPHEDFLAKINAVRYAFLELGIEDGIIVARTDSLGASLTQKIPVSKEAGDIASQYTAFLDTQVIDEISQLQDGDMAIKLNGQLQKPIRLDNGLYQFKAGTEKDRVVLDCVTSLQAGADLLWIETEKPNVEQIAELVNRIREQVPNAKLVYNNSPSFNWTLKFREQAYEALKAQGKDLSSYPDPSLDPKALMAPELDSTELAKIADEKVKSFQLDGATHAGIFHHLITLPTYHTVALSTDILAEGYFGDLGMLAYVRDVQRQEIRREQASVKHQDLAGSNIGDTHKEYFSGDNALKAGGEANTMNQF
ncbi:isocitrate lyase [Pseudoalteromonas luteoviolacea]|uniref:Isocitrate lyase n=1 Tax=Pseudoalteromonas luteoviolacea S4054 TaxID=1129367 RepID=A0A0F6A9G5_9GAMM|nr:isocitrate lyase [Pseudoalteromonas luteoviolacea]AOT10768.1 isocitrate lyase [Pseudoalteromonas luteoviolacea]AOT16069.1 isocitrate lyase [Pseudoalteromonas luteoviolacea]AOT20589.1 isocitrate lyase [Pseudoalteromonas luteoviolacea]KKE82805.1 isocitrate lyase [Pseudoalteromonas luteoviolacea S4054]KZN75313.1 isocitrate lyase [Pseudoalteromonas luteoviolacea S4047-1]